MLKSEMRPACRAAVICCMPARHSDSAWVYASCAPPSHSARLDRLLRSSSSRASLSLSLTLSIWSSVLSAMVKLNLYELLIEAPFRVRWEVGSEARQAAGRRGDRGVGDATAERRAEVARERGGLVLLRRVQVGVAAKALDHAVQGGDDAAEAALPVVHRLVEVERRGALPRRLQRGHLLIDASELVAEERGLALELDAGSPHAFLGGTDYWLTHDVSSRGPSRRDARFASDVRCARFASIQLHSRPGTDKVQDLSMHG